MSCMGTDAKSDSISVTTSSVGESSPIWRFPMNLIESTIRIYRIIDLKRTTVIKKSPHILSIIVLCGEKIFLLKFLLNYFNTLSSTGETSEEDSLTLSEVSLFSAL